MGWLRFAVGSMLMVSVAQGGPATVGNRVFPYEVQRVVLDNGLKVLLVPMPSEGLCAYWSIVRTGSRDEVEKGVTGFAHFFEHMMFRGSEKFPGPVYDSIVSGMGADANAFTSDDLTAYHMSFTSSDLPRVIEIEADRFQNLKYSEEGFRTESGAVYGEYRKGRTSPFYVLYEGMLNTAFDQHTYKHMTIGFEADIQQMPEQFEYSKTFFQRFYRPENVVILVVGDFDPAAALQEIRARYSSWKTGYQAPAVPTEPPHTAQRRVDIPFEGQTLPIVAVGFLGEKFLPGDRTMMAATLIGDLAFGETSELYKKLVLDEQRLEFLSPDFGENRDPGLWSILARVKDPADVTAIEGEIWSAVDQLRTQPVEAGKLDDVRSSLKYGILSRLTTPSQVAESLARLIAITGDLSCVEEMFATLDQVTPADVQRAAQTYLTPERSTVAVLHSASQPLPDTQAMAAASTVLLPVEADPNVSFKVWFRVGSQDDPPGKEGLAALTASLLTEAGTERFTYDELLEKLFPLAASYGSSVDKEMTVISGQCHRDHVDRFYPLFVDALLKPGFREPDFERLRDQAVLFLENTLRYSSDEELGKAALYEAVFQGTPYAHLVTGTVAGLKSITLKDVEDFYHQHFSRDRMVVALGGSYADTLPARLHADLARLPEGAPQEVSAPTAEPLSGRQVVLVDKPGPSTAISFGHPIDVHRGSREFYALWLANSWLGEHRNSFSHLYNVIREARGMNYGDYSYIEVFPGGGFRNFPPTGVGRRQQLFEVWVRPVPRSQALFALRAALREVDLLVKNGMTQEQFLTTREFLKKYCLHYAETTADRLGYAVDDRYYGIEEGHLKRLRRMLDQLTREDVNAALRKYIDPENLLIAMVTEDAAGMRQALLSGEPSPIDYAGVQKPAEILAEDQEIESYPLQVKAGSIQVIPVQQMFAGKGAGEGQPGAE